MSDSFVSYRDGKLDIELTQGDAFELIMIQKQEGAPKRLFKSFFRRRRLLSMGMIALRGKMFYITELGRIYTNKIQQRIEEDAAEAEALEKADAESRVFRSSMHDDDELENC